MSIRNRLIFLVLSLIVLLIVGRVVTGDFEFLLTQFWFTAGFFLLLLLSLIDQPHFSKDANIFVNGTIAWVSLFLVSVHNRDGIWWSFFGWASYLIISSYILMWIRAKEFHKENLTVQIASRVNRQIGRPEALFSAFFLWGAVQHFGASSPKLSPLFLFWAVFMILNLPALSTTIDNLLSRKSADESQRAGVLLSIISPRVAEVSLSPEVKMDFVRQVITLRNAEHKPVASGVIIDDRVVTGKRIGRVAITNTERDWPSVGGVGHGEITMELTGKTRASDDDLPISVIDDGTEIGKIVFYIHPNQQLESGEVLWVNLNPTEKAFYQVISAIVRQTPLPDSNRMHSVRVTAGQLGRWDEEQCRFEPITWVAPAGELIHKAAASARGERGIPARHEEVGKIPNSNFPVHVSIEDIITHNTAAIGVTGSGKSFLAFQLIEAMLNCSIKVMILDISRQHDIYLRNHSPTALRTAGDVGPWWNSESLLGIHQFGGGTVGYPKTTADFVAAAFVELSKAKLERGRNLPARLCIVFEEAHSLIPEWNQVAQKDDSNQVNRTARTILQGRKFGMGALIITQRTANVTKTILNQCNTIFAMQSFDQTGLDFLKNYMGEEYSQAIATLPTRHAILVGKASSSTRPLLFSVTELADRWTEEPAAEPADQAAQIEPEAPDDPVPPAASA